MLYLNELGVNIFMRKYNSLMKNAYWNNYDLIIWKKNYNGFFKQNGLFRKTWGVADKVSVDQNGMWALPKQYVKYFK